MTRLNLDEGKSLVRMARGSIEFFLEKGKKPKTPKVSEKLRQEMGVFVTLTEDGNLRGCIGRPLPTQPLVEGVIDAAISSAIGDPRFPKVKMEEMENIEVEVSILTPPQPIEVEDPKEYPKKIDVGNDGLIMKLGSRKGLLLPQVPIEQGWDVEEFLSNLCLKAGLMPDAWLQRGVKIEKFSAQIFSEREPGGSVEARRLSERAKH